MFNILSRYRNQNKGAEKVYALCLSTARNPVFYEHYNVPDTFDGRFEILVLHVFFVMQATKNDGEFHQNLFDAMFKDMDQTLREMGIGDMGVPKRMRKMMTGFNGRIHAYGEDMRVALGKNVYGTVENINDGDVHALYTYTQNVLENLQSTPVDAIHSGNFTFFQPSPITAQESTS